MAFGTSLFPGIGVIIFKSQINNKEKIIENKAEKEIGIEIDASGGGVMKKAFLLLLISIFPLISGCVGKHEDVDIYASIYPVEFLVREIVGDIYKVKPVYPVSYTHLAGNPAIIDMPVVEKFMNIIKFRQRIAEKNNPVFFGNGVKIIVLSDFLVNAFFHQVFNHKKKQDGDSEVCREKNQIQNK